MVDPGVECPDCGARLGARADCAKCGWKPSRAAVSGSAFWQPPPVEDRGGAVDPSLLRAELDKLYVKFGVPLENKTKPVKTHAIARCEKCALGQFQHGGVRYCFACYRRL